MHSRFDEIVDRSDTSSLKWDRYKGKDVLPFWVADMDFKSSPEVIEALKARAEHGVFGYTIPDENLLNLTVQYQKKHYGVDIEKDWLVWFPGVVPGLNVACRAFAPGGSVMTLSPTYPPFFSAPGNVGCELIDVPLKENDNLRYDIDFEAMEAAVRPDTKLFILCNPQNPVGRVWTREDLERIVDFCEKHDMILCSDEIHCDLILDEDKKHVTITAIERAHKRSFALMAPSKTYNVPGLGCSFFTFPDKELKKRFEKARAGLVTEVNAFGYVGCRAAMEHGENWRQDLLAYLRGNRDLIVDFFKKNIPQIKATHVEATYLMWLDPRELEIANIKQFFEKAGVGLSDGVDYGRKGYLRFNFGCPRSMLEEGLKRMKAAVDQL
jgi:cystathionine beta-lyase